MANQTKEAKAFLARVASLPAGPVCLDAILQASIEDEFALRQLWATDKLNPRLTNSYVGLRRLQGLFRHL
ncbi:hypothetical protein BDQ17DRAFT_1368893 [Cyathus striatus]|nr:hypothetical protein BDQ17DRAFT_1368893 [Cyathus striatus]